MYLQLERALPNTYQGDPLPAQPGVPACATCILQPKCVDYHTVADQLTQMLQDLAEALPQPVDWGTLAESMQEWLEEAVAPECGHYLAKVVR